MQQNSTYPPVNTELSCIETIPIFLSADENYVRYVAVVIASIMEQTEHSITFHILDHGISNIIKNKLLLYITSYPKAHILFHKIPLKEIQDFPTPGYFSSAIYARFYIADLVPYIDKALYIDIDTCIVGDISEIFNYNLKGYGLGAVSEDIDNSYLHPAIWRKEHKKKLGIKENESYFCSGVLLVDCTYWRKYSIKERCLAFMNNTTYQLPYPDQDTLNVIFQGNYKILPPHIQYFASASSEIYDSAIMQYMKDSHTVIIHYASTKKPWNTPEKEELSLSTIWWKYAKLTPFYHDFLLNLIHIQITQLKEIKKKTYKKSFYTLPFMYLKYKTSYGKKRKKYKKQYHALKTI